MVRVTFVAIANCALRRPSALRRRHVGAPGEWCCVGHGCARQTFGVRIVAAPRAVFVIIHLAHLHLTRERITHRPAIVSRHGQDCIDEGIVAVYDDARRFTRARPSDLDDNAWTSRVGIIRNLDLRISNALRGMGEPRLNSWPGLVCGVGMCSDEHPAWPPSQYGWSDKLFPLHLRHTIS